MSSENPAADSGAPFPTRVFLSDLHLGDDAPGLIADFEALLAGFTDVDECWLLGDVFDSYIGDDDDSATLTRVVVTLRALVGRGTQLRFIAGNRDFAVGAGFAERVGLTLCAEIESLAEQALLCHGDHLCTDDVAYQALRRKVRDPAWLAQALSQPLAVRRAFAEQLRQQSREHTRVQPMAIMDVNADAVVAAFAAHPGAHLLIHGHTHRPGIHELGDARQRVVLGDWRAGEPSWLRWDATGLTLHAHGQVWRGSPRCSAVSQKQF
ncbi:MAG: UDP-2,3-diacylglucosamine diphosphatase [Xanthomonadales bacterium]|jgi:UDP-2,3-diacylglucosamine hydrolase|nr:UDP-2,3-diacylglucosamine diphosphatase [Xanthomonadales bacterium]